MGRLIFYILVILSISGFSFISVLSETVAKNLSKSLEKSKASSRTFASGKDKNTGVVTPDLDVGRTLDHLSWMASNMMNWSLGGGDWSSSSWDGNGNKNNSCTGSVHNTVGIIEAIKIPLFIIVPAIIIGVVLLIKKVGLFTAWLPSKTAPFFHSFKHGASSGDGWSSGSGGYSPGIGYAPSPAYGAPSASSKVYYPPDSTLSRQTAILNSIDTMNAQYNQPVATNGGGDYPGFATNNNGNVNTAANTVNAGNVNSNAPDYMPYYYPQPSSKTTT